MRYGIILALALTWLVAGATCFPLVNLDPESGAEPGATLAVSVMKPAEDRDVPQGAVIEIEWTAANLTGFDAIATILVRAREDSSETILEGGLRLPEAGGSRSLEWDTSTFQGGAYSIVARVEAGSRTEEASAPARITINTPPSFDFIEPTERTELKLDPEDFYLGSSTPTAAIRWEAFDANGDGTAQIGVDPFDPNDPDDWDRESGDEITIAEVAISRTEGLDSLEWDGTDEDGQPVEAGEYNFYAVVGDSMNKSRIVKGSARIVVPEEPNEPELVGQVAIGRVESLVEQPPLKSPDSEEPNCFWGWDELSEHKDPNGPIVADDWAAGDDRPVCEIRWWGSYRRSDDDQPPEELLKGFHIAIWTGTPEDPNDPNGFAHPDRLIWEWSLDPNDNRFAETHVGCDYYEGIMASSDACFQYSYVIPKSNWFPQLLEEGVYWISISARYTDDTSEHRWGWTTTRQPRNAVRINGFDPKGPPGLGARYSSGEVIHPVDSDDSWGLAFELSVAELPEEVEFLPSDDALTIWFTLDEQDEEMLVDIEGDVDDNHNNGNEVPILLRHLIEKETSDDSFEWDGTDTTGADISDGIYRMVVVVNRGVGSPTTIAADHLVFRRSKQDQPLIALLQPNDEQTISIGTDVRIEWRDDDPNESATIRLTLDDDEFPAEDTETDNDEIEILADWPAADDGVQDTFILRYRELKDLEVGRYHVFAYIDSDDTAPADNVSIAGGELVIEDPEASGD